MQMRLTIAAALTAAICAFPAGWLAAAEESGRPAPRQVEMFAAIKAGEIEVTVIPRDETQLNVVVENKTDQPLAIQLPDAFVAAPVLAQLFPPFPPNQPPQQPNQQNQVIGGGGPNGQALNGGPFGAMPFGPGAMFNVPPGKVVKTKLATVCLEFGKPSPRPKIPYEIRPLESHSSDPALHQLLVKLGSGEHDPTIVQLAAWHLASGQTWQQLADVKHLFTRGQYRRTYSKAQLAAAKQLVKTLPQSKPEESSSSASKVSQR